MIERICKNCRHSIEHELDKDWLHCVLGQSENGEAIFPQSLAVAQDYESYRAFLEVRPHFGCNQFEGL